MPALAMQRHRLAGNKFRPDFVTGDIGSEHLCAARTARLPLRQDRRNQHRARMAVERYVIVVEYMRGDAVDQRRGLGCAPGAGGNERGERRAATCAQFAVDQRDFGIARTGDQHAKTVGNAGAGDGAAFSRNLPQTQPGNEMSKLDGESAHLRLHCGGARRAIPPYSAALSSAGAPARNCSSSAASSALAVARCLNLTWPKPRIFSGMTARPTARW